MLKTLEEIFKTDRIRTGEGTETIQVHSHTSKEQGLFLQSIFDLIKPERSVEVGFAYGISAMFILEKHREYHSEAGAHVVIEPDTYWGNTAVFNIRNEGLDKYMKIEKDYSDVVLSRLYRENHRIQYAYVDTTKRFDIVFHDFYFIDKILDIGGVIILDDCGGNWPGIQRVARYINSLPHYALVGRFKKMSHSRKRVIVERLVSFFIGLIPFKNLVFPGMNFATDVTLGLDYNCLAFQKKGNDDRDWKFDKPF